MSVLEHIKIPLSGFLLTVGGYVASLEALTVVAQFVTAVLAAITGIITLIIALRKLLKR